MNKLKLYISYIIIILSININYAQDPHFTQFYAAPLYLSPSLAGTTAGGRAIINFRDQWTAIPGAFVTYSIGLDHYLPRFNSGLGFYIMRDQAGSGKLATTNVAFQYTYNILLFKKWSIRPGIQFYHSQRSIQFSELIFNDQITHNGTNSTSIETPSDPDIGYFDFAFSTVAYSLKQWFGFTIDHIARPNQSLTNTVSNIPVRFIMFGGYKFMVSGRMGGYTEESVNLAWNYRAQGKFDQFDIGAYWTKYQFMVGLWYRGLPGLKAYKPGYFNDDMLAVLGGYEFKAMNLKIAYSYDFTISKLVAKTGGAHEISIQYLFNQNLKVRKKRRFVIIPCPKF